MSRIHQRIWFTFLILILAFSVTGCSEDTPPDLPDVTLDVVQSECDYDAQCEGKVELASCQAAKCVAGSCQGVQAGLWAECSMDGLGDCQRGGCDSTGTCLPISSEDGSTCRSDEWDYCAGYTCQSGQCTSMVLLSCDDDNSCTDDTCDGTTGDCTYVNNQSGCDDGNLCTGGDTCGEGNCVGADNLCQCEQDADCDAYDDGDKCNGVMMCDVPNKLCVPMEDSAIICDTSEDPACQTNTCNPGTGTCGLVKAEDYSACSDGEMCTGCAPNDADCATFDYCSNGSCQAGQGTPCGCEADADCLVFDDGNACNGGYICTEGLCTEDAASVVDCSGQEAPSACQAIACNPANGACEPVDLEEGIACDDGNQCSGGDTCQSGVCTAGDENVCACDEATDCGQFDDGNACNGTWSCQEGSCAFDDATVLGDADADGICDDTDVCTGDDASGDADSDGTCADLDSCDDDPGKLAAGVCGCSVADTDTDNDGTPNCNDGCSDDPDKTDPGACGCAKLETDSDDDGTPDCVDNCPDDPEKTEAGLCGCGALDTDSDNDGTPNCLDVCSDDPNKTEAGTCGCGVVDFDSDEDGTLDCEDGCVNDANKTEAGTCGCGIADTDSDEDGTADCSDQCPADKDKVIPGECGCGVADTPGCN